MAEDRGWEQVGVPLRRVVARWTFADEIERKKLRAEKLSRRYAQLGIDKCQRLKHALDPDDTHPLSVEREEKQA